VTYGNLAVGCERSINSESDDAHKTFHSVMVVRGDESSAHDGQAMTTSCRGFGVCRQEQFVNQKQLRMSLRGLGATNSV
jgi:hypothetical protein